MNINTREWSVQDDTTTGEVVSHSVWTPELEPIEYAPIVRCKDCKRWKNKHLCEAWSRYGTIETKENDFCSYGEKK